MTELITLALIALIIFREYRHEQHVRELEERLMAGNLTEFHQAQGKKTGEKTNPVMKTEENEVMLLDQSFMEIPKEYKIEVEGDSETPAEAVARGGR